MYERRYGAKYHATQGEKWLTAADIARLMRADLKEAKAAGDLPADLKVSVTVENYSMGRSINMLAEWRAEFWQVCDGFKVGSKTPLDGGGYIGTSCGYHWCSTKGEGPNYNEHEVLTEEGERVLKVLQSIHRSYNYDGSEIQVDYFDVNYYGSAEIESAERHRWNQQEAARKAKMRADAPRKKQVIEEIMSLSRFQKRGRLRNVSLERLEAHLASLKEKEAANA